MAMQMTHLRFALDLEKQLDIHDAPRYLSGALYPDSRYITKIARQATHDENVPDDLFAKGWTDFEKGWATHIYYDRVALPGTEAFVEPTMLPIVGGTEGWLRVTAVKIIEDHFAYTTIDNPPALLADLHAVPAPRNEDAAALERHYDSLRGLYEQQPTFDRYVEHFVWMGLRPAQANRLRALLDEFSAEQVVILDIYDHVLTTVWEAIRER